MKKRENIKGIDYSKAFAIISVLILHLYLPEEIDKKYLLRECELFSVNSILL